jgi:hypothetical protein
MKVSDKMAATQFVNWVYYLAWLSRSGHNPISWPEYRSLHA